MLVLGPLPCELSDTAFYGAPVLCLQSPSPRPHSPNPAGSCPGAGLSFLLAMLPPCSLPMNMVMGSWLCLQDRALQLLEVTRSTFYAGSRCRMRVEQVARAALKLVPGAVPDQLGCNPLDSPAAPVSEPLGENSPSHCTALNKHRTARGRQGALGFRSHCLPAGHSLGLWGCMYLGTVWLERIVVEKEVSAT